MKKKGNSVPVHPDKIATIHFVDNGQDFLTWVIGEGGEVIDCFPFQASIWCGEKVSNLDDLMSGRATHVDLAKRGDRRAMRLIHAVREIEKHRKAKR